MPQSSLNAIILTDLLGKHVMIMAYFPLQHLIFVINDPPTTPPPSLSMPI